MIAILRCPACQNQIELHDKDLVVLCLGVMHPCTNPPTRYQAIFDIRRANGMFGSGE